MFCHGQYDSHGYDTSKVVLNRRLTDYTWSLKTAYIYQSGSYAEVGILRQKRLQDLYYHPGEFYGTSGPSIACEINLDFDKKIIGPKVAYEINVFLFSVKANLIYYTDFGNSSTCFTPEFGLSFFGFLVLSTRYTIPFYNKELLFEKSGDALSFAVTINFPLKAKTRTVSELRQRNNWKAKIKE